MAIFNSYVKLPEGLNMFSYFQSVVILPMNILMTNECDSNEDGDSTSGFPQRRFHQSYLSRFVATSLG